MRIFLKIPCYEGFLKVKIKKISLTILSGIWEGNAWNVILNFIQDLLLKTSPSNPCTFGAKSTKTFGGEKTRSLIRSSFNNWFSSDSNSFHPQAPNKLIFFLEKSQNEKQKKERLKNLLPPQNIMIHIIITHHRVHQIPKRFLVIFFPEMSEFMDNDAVDNFGICFEKFCQSITKTQSIFAATRSPASFGFSDFDAGIFR